MLMSWPLAWAFACPQVLRHLLGGSYLEGSQLATFCGVLQPILGNLIPNYVCAESTRFAKKSRVCHLPGVSLAPNTSHVAPDSILIDSSEGDLTDWSMIPPRCSVWPMWVVLS